MTVDGTPPRARPAHIREPQAGTIGHTQGQSLELGRVASEGEVDTQLIESSRLLVADDELYIDMTAVHHLEVPGILRLLEVMAARAAERRATLLRLPSESAARHILRQWRFRDAAEAVTGTPFRLLVHPDDLRYFGEKITTRQGMQRYATNSRASVLAYLAERQHFGFAAYRVDHTGDLADMMMRETEHWSGYAITKLLDKLLEGGAAEVCRVIIPELAANVVQHAEPGIAVVASQLTLPYRALPGWLTIAMWDNGESIISTLRSAITAGPIRVSSPEVREDLAVRAVGWRQSREHYITQWTPAVGAPDQELLIASLLPGVTCKADQRPGQGHRSGLSSTGPSASAGYGLYALYKTVTGTLGGTVEIRSEQNRLTVEPDHKGGATITVEHDSAVPRMRGDVVTVRVPVKDA